VASDVSYLVAFGGGLVSFASPCVLPLVPAYLSIVTGFDFSGAEDAPRRPLAPVVRDTGLFVLGFGAVFVALGVSASAIGSAFQRAHLPLTRISGALVIAMGLFLALSLVARLPFLFGEARLHPSAKRLGIFAAPIIGVAFGFGWTPCVTPVLSSVLAIAASEGGATHGAVLLAIYALGLGVPFLAIGCGLTRLAGAMRAVRRHSSAITLVSAVVMLALGILLVADRVSWISSELGALR
jgi:cytochrome c-type biogenesis protein